MVVVVIERKKLENLYGRGEKLEGGRLWNDDDVSGDGAVFCARAFHFKPLPAPGVALCD